MTRSARAKKAKKADFAKTKLKVGKRLKKAQNETRTDFKARKIILKEQLTKKSQEELLTRKKRNIKDLLTCLGNTNTYVRQDGLNGLLELIKKNDTDALIPKLSQIIAGVAPCVFDIDVLIRSATIKFIEALLVKVGNHVEPYFSVLAIHLSCAMVHLNTGVQADSLRLINLFVRHTPALLARHSNTLLTNFVNLISRKTMTSQIGGSKREMCVDFTRMLHTNPSNSLTSHQGHVELLQELSGVLEVIVKEQQQVQKQIPLTMWQRVVAGSVAPMSEGGSGVGRDGTHTSQLFSDSEHLHKFVQDIVPLLFQVWAEVDPKNYDGMEDGNVLDDEGAKALSSILAIITHIITITTTLNNDQQQPHHQNNGDWLAHDLRAQYMYKIMPGFPYYTHSSQLKARKRNKKVTQRTEQSELAEECAIRHCDSLNVTLASLAVQLNPIKHFQHKATSFMSKLLCDKAHDGEYSMAEVVNVLLHVIKEATAQDAESLLNSAFACYRRLHPLRKDRTHLLRVLLAVTHIANPELWKCRSVGEWVEVMVEELCSVEVQDAVLQTAITLRLQGNTSITHLLTTHRMRVTDNLQEKGVPGMDKTSLNKRLQFLLKGT